MKTSKKDRDESIRIMKKTFRTRLKELSDDIGVGQNALARHIGISNSAMSFFINGHTYPGLETLIRIHLSTGIGIDYLLGAYERE